MVEYCLLQLKLLQMTVTICVNSYVNKINFVSLRLLMVKCAISYMCLINVSFIPVRHVNFVNPRAVSVAVREVVRSLKSLKIISRG